MNTLILNWIYIIFILSTTMFCGTVQLTTMNDALQNNYTDNYAYVQDNVNNNEYDNDSNLPETDFMTTLMSFDITDIIFFSFGLILILALLAGCIWLCVAIYKILKNQNKNSYRTISGTAERTDNVQSNRRSLKRQMTEVFALRRRNSSPSNRQTRNRQFSETEEFQMIDLPLEEPSYRFVYNMNTEIQRQERYPQDAQRSIILTRAIIERENISDDDLKKLNLENIQNFN